MAKSITVESTIKASIQKVWDLYTKPEHIVKWNNASEDWHTTKAENDLRAGGRFLSRMESKDGSFGFDFSGVYNEVIENSLISYTMDDDRKVVIAINEENGSTKVSVDFELESENSEELQREGRQAILDNFKKYVESN